MIPTMIETMMPLPVVCLGRERAGENDVCVSAEHAGFRNQPQ
jgi:hypothetical protein